MPSDSLGSQVAVRQRALGSRLSGSYFRSDSDRIRLQSTGVSAPRWPEPEDQSSFPGPSSRPGYPTPIDQAPPSRDEEYEAALQASREEYDNHQRRAATEQEEAELALARSAAETEAAMRQRANEEYEQLSMEREIIEQSMLDEAKRREAAEEEELAIQRAMEQSQEDALRRKFSKQRMQEDSELQEAIVLSLSLAERGAAAGQEAQAGPVRVLGPTGLSEVAMGKRRLMEEALADQATLHTLAAAPSRRPLPAPPTLREPPTVPAQHLYSLVADRVAEVTGSPDHFDREDDPFDDRNEVPSDFSAHRHIRQTSTHSLRPLPKPPTSVARRRSSAPSDERPVVLPPPGVASEIAAVRDVGSVDEIDSPSSDRGGPQPSAPTRISPRLRPSEMPGTPPARFGFLHVSLKHSALEVMPDVVQLSLVDDPVKFSTFVFEATTLRCLLRFLSWHGEGRLEGSLSDIERAKGKPLRAALHLSILRDAIRLEVQLVAQTVTPTRSTAYKRGQSRFTLPQSPIELPSSLASLAQLVLTTWQEARRVQRSDEAMFHLAADVEHRALEAGEDISRERYEAQNMVERIRARLLGRHAEPERDRQGLDESALLITPFDLSAYG